MDKNLGIYILGEGRDPFVHSLTHWLLGRGFTLIDSDEKRTPGIAVYSPGLSASPEQLPEGVPLIFRSDCAPAAAFAARHTGPLLDYGFSYTDTLTFSSLTEQQAVVALQRPIFSQTGETLEPQEIPVPLTEGADAELLLPAAGICLLSGRMDALDTFP